MVEFCGGTLAQALGAVKPWAVRLSPDAILGHMTALAFSRVSYVAPAREVGIVIGALLGVFLLKEPFGRSRLLGSCFIVAGLVLIALSP